MARRLSVGDVARRFPVTLGILSLTLVFFFVEHQLGGATDPVVYLRLGALRADRVAEHGEYWRLLMPLFLHHGWLHLVLNGFALLQLGALVESIWGGRRLLLFYVVCGLGASLASATLNTAPLIGSVGSSGAIMGLAGVVLGTSWYGRDPVRTWLLDLVGQRLLHGVMLTFGLGMGLWLVLDFVDNWAHFGGFVTGLLIAAATPDPTREDVPRTIAAASAAGAALLASVSWMVLDGARPEAEVHLDIARTMATRISEQPGTWTATALLPELLGYYQRAEAPDEGLEVFERAVDDLSDPTQLWQLTGALYARQSSGEPWADRPLEISAERWLAVAPDDPDVLNTLAWHLVTRPDVARRDPARAEALSRRSLELIPDPDGRTARRQRAAYLDTLGEILFQLGELDEARQVQRESVELAHAVDAERWPLVEQPLPIDEMQERLQKIEEST